MTQLGFCGAAVCEALAEFMGESGAESPSGAAVLKAMDWLREPAEMVEFIRASGKWCMSPTVGCMRECQMWMAGSLVHGEYKQ